MSAPSATLYTQAATAPIARIATPKSVPKATRTLRRIEPRERRCRLRARCVMRSDKGTGGESPVPALLLEQPRRAERPVRVLSKLGLLVSHLGALAVARSLELEPDPVGCHLRHGHLGGARRLQDALRILQGRRRREPYGDCCRRSPIPGRVVEE